jgi:hypothetical protein
MLIPLFLATLTPPTAQQYYSQALDAMKALRPPAYIAYRTDARVRGAGMFDPDCSSGSNRVAFGWGKGTVPAVHWETFYRTKPDDAVVKLASGAICRSGDFPLFKPTFGAVYGLMRYGFNPEPAPEASAIPAPGAAAPSAPPVIAEVTAVEPSAYRVSDAGSAPCPGGSPGHALHLVAVRDPDNHPLTDVVVDTRSQRFCSMRFRLFDYFAAGSGFKGDMTVQFGDTSGQWLINDVHAEFAMRLLGASLKQVQLGFAYSDVRFPAQIPPDYAAHFNGPK